MENQTTNEDWSAHDQYLKGKCECMCGCVFMSHSKFSGRRVRIISRDPCPKCGSDMLRSASTGWESQTLTTKDVGSADE